MLLVIVGKVSILIIKPGFYMILNGRVQQEWIVVAPCYVCALAG